MRTQLYMLAIFVFFIQTVALAMGSRNNTQSYTSASTEAQHMMSDTGINSGRVYTANQTTNTEIGVGVSTTEMNSRNPYDGSRGEGY